MASRSRFKYSIGQKMRHLGGTSWFRVTTRRLNHGGAGQHRYWGEYQPSVGGMVGAYEDQIVPWMPARVRHLGGASDTLLKLARDERTDRAMLVRSLLELVEGVEGGWLVRDPELASERTVRSILRRAHAALGGR